MSLAPEVIDGMVLVHVDADLIVVDKPGGMLSVPGRHVQDSVATRVRQIFPDALTVHRLDQETSGLLVLARGKPAHRRLSMAFERRQVKKRYIAVVAGCPTPADGEIDLPLICDWPNRPRQMVSFEHGKPSLTRYTVVAREGNGTRLALMPETGRSHQLRVHLQAVGHPILGDALYADVVARDQATRLLLHAEFLAFDHPRDGNPVEFRSPAPF